MAMAMGNGNGDGDVVGDDNGDGVSNHNGNSHGKDDNDKGRVASSCANNVQCYGWATPCLDPHGHKGKCIY